MPLRSGLSGSTSSTRNTPAYPTAASPRSSVLLPLEPPPPGNPTLELTATEGADTAAFTIGLQQRIVVAATEGADTPSFSVRIRPRITLAATEAPDTPSFTVGLRQRVALAATEASDTASFAVGLRQRAALAATEGADTASFTLAALSTASLALSTTEAADTAAFAIAGRVSVSLATTEGADTAAFTVDVIAAGAVTVALAGSESPDSALFTLFAVPSVPEEDPRKERILVAVGGRKPSHREEFSTFLDKVLSPEVPELLEAQTLAEAPASMREAVNEPLSGDEEDEAILLLL